MHYILLAHLVLCWKINSEIVHGVFGHKVKYYDL